MVFAAVANFVGDDDTAAGEASPVQATTVVASVPVPVPVPVPVSVVPPPAEVSSGPAAPPETSTVAPPPAVAQAYSDPRCAPASPEVVALVADGLTTDGHELANGTVINENGTTYFGATTLDAVGDMDARSDVWIVRDGAVYSSTGGARNGTSFPRASEVLGISPGDPIVTAVDTCVVDRTG
ncbi:DUF2510 domain-containing protein [Nocardia sp. NBC_01329]|uniref:DUF2510 domain-containing protein n=1 Tax=Nocardia sp. NBC_01329 TaxID=2903594 RepID=UPI002E13D8B2|nr:DUF2510 domain-containing protein [Nocardia sp. NBC_01329]